LEYWSIAPGRNCTPLPRGWRCFQGVSYNATNPGLKPWAILCSRLAANSRHFVPGRLRRLRRTRSLQLCATNRCDRDVGFAESGYHRFVPPGQKNRLFNPAAAGLGYNLSAPKCSGVNASRLLSQLGNSPLRRDPKGLRGPCSLQSSLPSWISSATPLPPSLTYPRVENGTL
jgi:hypothetical protein